MHIKEKYKNESGQNNNIYYINEAESRRINIAKVWFTIMVIYIHSYSEAIKFTTGSVSINMPLEYEMIQYILSQAISRCAVPAFFLILSILLYRKQFLWKNNIKKKIKTLLVPYIILNGF